MLLVCSYFSNKQLPRYPKDFKLKKDEELCFFGLNMTINDVLKNNVHKPNQLFQSDSAPGHGAKEKDFVLICVLFWACYVSGNIVVDLNTSIDMLPCSIESILLFIACKKIYHDLHNFPLVIGTSIHVCHNKNKHIALEGDKDIFDNIFKPLANERPNDELDEKHGDPNLMFLDDNDIVPIVNQGPLKLFCK
jgi:hypothetical protein